MTPDLVFKVVCAAAVMLAGFRIEINDTDNGWSVFGGAAVLFAGYVWLMIIIWQ